MLTLLCNPRLDSPQLYAFLWEKGQDRFEFQSILNTEFPYESFISSNTIDVQNYLNMAPIQVLLITEEYLNFHRIILSGLTHNVFNHNLQNIILYLTPLFLRHKMKYDTFKKEWNIKNMLNWMLARTTTSFNNHISIQGLDLKSTETSGRHKIFLNKSSTKNLINIAELIIPLYNESSFHYHFIRKINLRALWKLTNFLKISSSKLPILAYDIDTEFKLAIPISFNVFSLNSNVYTVLRSEVKHNYLKKGINFGLLMSLLHHLMRPTVAYCDNDSTSTGWTLIFMGLTITVISAYFMIKRQQEIIELEKPKVKYWKEWKIVDPETGEYRMPGYIPGLNYGDTFPDPAPDFDFDAVWDIIL